MLSSIYVWCVRYRSSIFNYVINIFFWAEWDFRNKYFKKMFSQKELSKSQKFFCHQLRSYWQFVEALQKAYSDMSEWVKSLSCVRLGDPMACRSLPCSSVRGIFQARVLEWVAIFFSRGSSWPRDWTLVSSMAGRFFTNLVTREAPKTGLATQQALRSRMWWGPANGTGPF